jgi:hypothetical protein
MLVLTKPNCSGSAWVRNVSRGLWCKFSKTTTNWNIRNHGAVFRAIA